ncbi:hypothetical protein QAD02_009763 [Eretmocerus hayati]|uniref:Uncharacterized protein n=1 Tax=Eretmocerus hayati TaxID=131215 RepID=A0ACC2NES0_9HYME|nr:hypothetical protein QAD02_009763 [Eretmocerus hayati]
MTNSTPKNHKIERHGSPNGNSKQKRSPNYVKTVTYFANGHNNSYNTPPPNGGNGGRNAKFSNTKQNCSPSSTSAKNIPRASPVRHDILRGSPTNSFYAGAKFSEPPSPASLPKPPSHWTGLMIGCGSEANRNCLVSQNLKMILNVQA